MFYYLAEILDIFYLINCSSFYRKYQNICNLNVIFLTIFTAIVILLIIRYGPVAEMTQVQYNTNTFIVSL